MLFPVDGPNKEAAQMFDSESEQTSSFFTSFLSSCRSCVSELKSISSYCEAFPAERLVRISARELPSLCHPMRSYDAIRKVS